MSVSMEQIRADIYEEIFEALRLPYSTAESVNDRAHRLTDKAIKHSQISKMSEAIRFYEDRLRLIKDSDTGGTEDEIDRLQFELEMVKIDKKKFSIELHDLKHAIREALCQIEGNKCDLSQGAASHEALHNAGVQRDMDIIIKCCGEFL